MALESSKIPDILKSPDHKSDIYKAVSHQNRLKFHTETYLSINDLSRPANDFLQWVNTLIPKDKFEIFVSLFQFPTPMVEITGKIFNELERVFDGRNKSVNHSFIDPKDKDDYEWYRKEKMKEPNVWREKGWSKVKSEINSVLIVDLPPVQTTERPEPYFYFLPICEVIDFDEVEEPGDSTLEWIMFKQEKNMLAVFDNMSYRIFECNETYSEIKKLVSEVPHNLGFCPAQFFWHTALNSENDHLKKSPLSSSLSTLDWILFFMTSKKHLDTYAPYPVYSTYSADCDFENAETANYCDGGFLRNRNNSQFVFNRNGNVEQCPICAGKRFAGAGSVLEIPAPDSNTSPDMRNPVQILDVAINSLKYNTEECDRLTNQLFTNITGEGSKVQKVEAINPEQVMAIAESKTSILNNLKVNFEKAQKFVDDTVAFLRYGKDRYLGSDINWGTEYYNYSVVDLYKQYKLSKDNGANESQLESLTNQIIEVENKTNQSQLQRAIILKQLEPYLHYNRAELLDLFKNGLVDKIALTIKINFNTFVDRFERENINITEFGVNLSLEQRVNKIMNEFKSYANEIQQTTPTQATTQNNVAATAQVS